ncbi:gamma-butyrobetaine dioxygenase [Hyalella azteca]|uniref:Gamma-butyrobetaine dioxygenase n=1 Tax=Hyalella azteca TaxID=294128 RepID=A0A8B7N4K4_HYAAZ|nr:gamma-butyrobetaine dioxygenase [Hyalella azteca]XP_018008278.1 gamma-butyrobetaine dioxygenase [Hyalella azteca]
MIPALRNIPKSYSKAAASLLQPIYGRQTGGPQLPMCGPNLQSSFAISQGTDKCKTCTQTCTSGIRTITTNQTDEKPALAQVESIEKSQMEHFNLDTESLKKLNPSVSETITVHPISAVDIDGTKIKLTLTNGETLRYPTVWLRDNCQCSNCFNPLALGRSFLMQNLLSAPEADDARLSDAGDVEIRWKDGHESVFKAEWLQRRAFTEQARQKYRSRFSLPKKQWSHGHKVAEFDYPSLMEDDAALLRWLVVLETWGATLLKQTPSQPSAAYDLCERVAKVKYTHYGIYSSVVNHPQANNLAYTNQTLNLHNDMPQYQEIPGLIFLHMVKQHRGEGGDTIISDGLRAAEYMREHYPQQFETLVTTDVYFWDKGEGKDQMEMNQFYKINKGPTIQLNNSGEVSTIRFNNQVRDSHLDLPDDKVEDFYHALQIYFRLMYDNSVSFKMQDGDMTVLDNVRCQHARQSFEGDLTARHLVTTFMSWDEALCRRRRLQEQFKL